MLGGWKTFQNKEGNLDEKQNPGDKGSINSDLLSEDHFRDFVIPQLNQNDTVVFLFQPNEKQEDQGKAMKR